MPDCLILGGSSRRELGQSRGLEPRQAESIWGVGGKIVGAVLKHEDSPHLCKVKGRNPWAMKEGGAWSPLPKQREQGKMPPELGPLP